MNCHNPDITETFYKTMESNRLESVEENPCVQRNGLAIVLGVHINDKIVIGSCDRVKLELKNMSTATTEVENE